jgi:hypothetical protein
MSYILNYTYFLDYFLLKLIIILEIKHYLNI